MRRWLRVRDGSSEIASYIDRVGFKPLIARSYTVCVAIAPDVEQTSDALHRESIPASSSNSI